MQRVFLVSVLAISALTCFAAPAQASLAASSTITPEQLGPGSYEYALTLTNTGTTPIGTFWFAWFPSYDLLPHAPTSISAPLGWTGVNAPDTFGVASVQWVNTASPLQPGQTLSGLKFDTPDSPAVLGDASQFFGVPVEQSYVYIGAPETDPGFALKPATVPEPTALALLLAAPAALLLRRKVVRRAGFSAGSLTSHVPA